MTKANNTKPLLAALLLAGTALTATACHKAPQQAQQTAAQIAWREGDVNDAFTEAKEQNKPVLLYWGARWCPPCNQMKQTLFQDANFIKETQGYIPVHLDGDAKGAQLWGEKFGIQGYPTVIILRPDRSEVTRLSGGSTAGQLAQVLKVAAGRTTSTEDLLKRAENPASLTADDWRLLASFDWMDDPKHFGDQAKTGAFLTKLADKAPDPAVKRHFALIALLLAMPDDKAKLTAVQQQQVASVLPAVLSDYNEVKVNRQELGFGGADLIGALPDLAQRNALGGQLVAALDKVAADESVPLPDRFDTISAEIKLSKAANGGKVTPDVLAKVRQRVAMADKAARDPSMRQAVMPSAGQALADAGDKAGAEKLWKGELAHAVAPYYFMVDLANLAEENGDKAGAVSWLKKAAETADGPATRIQWAVMYSQGVIRMTPADKAAVEQSAGTVIDALASNSAGYAERTRKRADKWAEALHKWSAAHGGSAVIARLSAKMAQSCKGSGCADVLKG